MTPEQRSRYNRHFILVGTLPAYYTYFPGASAAWRSPANAAAGQLNPPARNQ